MVEVQFGEGGEDSKIFVEELLSIYLKYGQSKGFACERIESDWGHAVAKFSGNGVWDAFKQEVGKHCVQRIPPTEANDRKQTSFVSVAVTALPEDKVSKPLPLSEIEYSYMRGTGPGGQNKNKVASCVRAVHRPTKLAVVIDGRDQGKNKVFATKILTAKVNKLKQDQQDQARNEIRKVLGQGGRGETEKIRTYNFLKGFVVDHRTGKKTGNVKAVTKGNLDLLK